MAIVHDKVSVEQYASARNKRSAFKDNNTRPHASIREYRPLPAAFRLSVNEVGSTVLRKSHARALARVLFICFNGYQNKQFPILNLIDKKFYISNV